MAVMFRACKFVAHLGLYLQVKRGSGRLTSSLPMLCVQSHHTAKQFRVFAITSNKVHFVKNFSRKKNWQFTDLPQ